ncbi:hypothetical protein A0O30_18725 [Pseudomonas sp. LLC-1]|uniref:hypothetical protein n=1 Tax=Pseudomonas sp. LLC-1 TaxID=1812180 RepID=UPI000D014D0E|nr:hypothetical protein [Pseudomonas sp. LLC-1]PRN03311.1 hypothetical protein A0O30_18725 [Pseudomonas sp. LLC-1]
MTQARDASIKCQVLELAKQHGVTSEKDRFSDLATTITNLAGDVVNLDDIERMLVALKKKGILTKRQILELEACYLNELSGHDAGQKISA